MFGKLITAVVTPFDEEGYVNYQELLRIVEHLMNTGSDGLVVLGTTGESYALSNKEKLKIVNFIKRVTLNRVPIIVNVGSYNTHETIEFAKKVEKVGIAGLMVVVPYYCKPQQEGIYQHIKAIHDATKKPIMIYEVPSRTGVKLEFSTIEKISQLIRVQAIKFASSDVDLAEQIVKNTKLALYCGNDDLIYKLMKRGATGAVSVVSHLRGQDVKEVIEQLSFSKMKSLKELIHLLAEETNPAPIKYALNQIGFNVGSPRLPLVEISDELKIKLDDAL